MKKKKNLCVNSLQVRYNFFFAIHISNSVLRVNSLQVRYNEESEYNYSPERKQYVCQFLIGKVQPDEAIRQCELKHKAIVECQFLIGKVQQNRI